MKTKKYKHADLENKRAVFFQIGLVVALGASLVAFEWGSTAGVQEMADYVDPFVEVDEPMEITRHEEPKKELPKLKSLEELIIVPDEVDDLGDEPDFSSEFTDAPIDLPEMAPEADDAPMTFRIVEHMPKFPGGNNELLKYVARNINYPVICAETGVAGKVYISFVVNEKGDVVETAVLRSPHAQLSTEALRVVNSMPRWTPGKQRDKAVRVSFTIPVNFVLQ